MINSEILEIDSLAQPTPAQHLQHNLAGPTNASLQHEEKPPDVFTPLWNQLARNPQQKHVHISADESRLLRGGQREPTDPSAVPIGTPQNKPLSQNMGSLNIPTGFEPKNTLYRSANPRKYTPKIPPMGQHLASGKTKETDEGNLVRTVATPNKSGSERSLKRQKLYSQGNSHDLADDVRFDPRLEEQFTVTIAVPDKSQRRSQEIFSQSPIQGIEQYVDKRGGVGEYSSLQRRMRTDLTQLRKARKNMGNGHLHVNDTSPTARTSVTSLSLDSDPIQDASEPELQDQKVESATRPKYMGTARTSQASNHGLPMTNRSNEQREGGKESPYFSSSRPRRSLEIQGFSIAKKRDGHKMQDKKLDEKFVSVDGQRRSGCPAVDSARLSPDELTGGTTTGNNNTRRQQLVDTRPKSPIKSFLAHEESSFRNNNFGLPSSNIPAATFERSKNRADNLRISNHRTTYDGEKRASWSIEIEAISTGGEVYQSETLGIDLDNETRIFNIRSNGSSLIVRGCNLQIHPKKIQRLSWSTDSNKIRVESSKCGTQDNTLDIQLCSHKDAFRLVKELNQHNAKTSTVSSDYMEKIFETKLSEQKRYTKSSRKNIAAESSFIPLAIKNDCRDSPESLDELDGPSDPKRRCRPDGVNDQEFRKPPLSQGMLASTGQAKSEIIIDLPGESLAAADFKPFGNEQTDTRSRLRKMRNELNPHLIGLDIRPQLRSRKIEVSPPPVRYSIHPGLGPEWRKPLLYPKTGKKKISVDWIDLERLDEGEYLNDTLVAFYLRFLEHQLEEKSASLAKKIYFFNTFFFASLTNTPKGKKGINYEAVKNWTRSIDIFSYDYIVVPINESQHWYLAIICNAAALARTPNETEDMPKDEPPLSPYDPISSVPSPTHHTSPRAIISIEEKASHLNKTQELDEQDPSASFADLSLETPHKSCTDLGNGACAEQGATNTDDVFANQNIADEQVQGTQIDSKDPERREIPSSDATVEQVYDNQVAVQDHGPKAPASPKKRKRKSIPPIQRTDPTSPLIITFDSLSMSHPSTIRILKDYLLAEGKAKRGMEVDLSRIRGLTAKQIPQQTNYCDCGLFLLGYIDKFLDAPKEFISKIIGHEYSIEKDWPKLNPSNLRASMRTQLQALHAAEEDERREKAKNANKYHSKQSQEAQSPSKDIAQPASNPTGMSASLLHQPQAAAHPPSTRKQALETALPIDGLETRYAKDIFSKNSKQSRERHFYQDSSDPLHEEVREVSAPRPRDEPFLIVIESQSNEAGNEAVIDYAEPVRNSSSDRRSVSVGFPSEIQDSQPSSFQDLHAAVENIPETPPQTSDSTSKDQYVADSGYPTLSRGAEPENNLESTERHANSEFKNSSEKGKPPRPTTPHEIVEIDD